ncbi:MAG: plasmid mobilization protein [Acidobacteriaceae bacterium]
MTEPKKTRKPGRPKLPKGDAKGKFLRVRITPEESTAIEMAAKANGQTVSDWIRNILANALGG